MAENNNNATFNVMAHEEPMFDFPIDAILVTPEESPMISDTVSNFVTSENPMMDLDIEAILMTPEEQPSSVYAASNILAPQNPLIDFDIDAILMAPEEPPIMLDAANNVMAPEEPLLIYDVVTKQITYQVRTPDWVQVEAPKSDDPFISIGKMLDVTPSLCGLSAVKVRDFLDDCEKTTVYSRYQRFHCASRVSVQHLNTGPSENRPVSEPVLPQPARRFVCDTCDKDYKTKQSWKAHMRRKHPDQVH